MMAATVQRQRTATEWDWNNRVILERGRRECFISFLKKHSPPKIIGILAEKEKNILCILSTCILPECNLWPISKGIDHPYSNHGKTPTHHHVPSLRQAAPPPFFLPISSFWKEADPLPSLNLPHKFYLLWPNTLAARGLEEVIFQLCCCVSFWFWREIGFGFTYLCT